MRTPGGPARRLCALGAYSPGHTAAGPLPGGGAQVVMARTQAAEGHLGSPGCQRWDIGEQMGRQPGVGWGRGGVSGPLGLLQQNARDGDSPSDASWPWALGAFIEALADGPCHSVCGRPPSCRVLTWPREMTRSISSCMDANPTTGPLPCSHDLIQRVNPSTWGEGLNMYISGGHTFSP